jgi:hypothetical protein
MAVLLKANGQIEVIDRGSEFPLDELQKLVGGYIEVVRPRFRGLALFPHGERGATTAYRVEHKTVMLVNEHGDSLPVNQAATELASISGWRIRGDVLLVLQGKEFS